MSADEQQPELSLTYEQRGRSTKVAISAKGPDGETYTTKVDIADEAERQKLADVLVQKWPAYSREDVAARLETVAADVVAPLDGMDGPDGQDEKASQADLLVRLARERFRISRAEADEPFVVALEGPRIARMLRGGKNSLRAELARAYNQVHGKVPSSSSLADALLTIEGEAQLAEAEVVHLRLATVGGRIVQDLGDPTGRVVVIDGGRWRIEDTSPVLFRRTELTGSIPAPVRGGDLQELRRLLNVTNSTWPVLVGWLVASWFPDIPHPIAFLGGLHGTGKSTAAEMLVQLIDASPAPRRTQPRDVEQWAMNAFGSWVVCVDNISSIPPWWSDALCRAVTGDGLVRRRLFTDDALSVLAFRRVILLTSIDAGALRGDLGDRLLHIDLDQIQPEHRRGEVELWSAYEEARPRITGALLDLVARVQEELPSVRLEEKGRMADFEQILAALDRIKGLGALDCYRGQRERIALDVIESDPVYEAILEMARSEREWIGTAGALREKLSPDKPPKGWPQNARAMAGAVRRGLPALMQVGVQVVPPSDARRGNTPSRDRLYTIRLIRVSEQESVHTVQPSRSGPHDPAKGEKAWTVGNPQPSNRPGDRPEEPGPGTAAERVLDGLDGLDGVSASPSTGVCVETVEERDRRLGWGT